MFNVNRIVKFFILIDLLFVAGWGFINALFSIFVVQTIEGATLRTAGIAVAVYWIGRALLQLPIANYLDKVKGERDDFYALIAGLLLASVSAFLFIFVDEIWELYAVQLLHAIAFALYVPVWKDLFSRHLDGDRIAFDWSLDNSIVGLAAGISGLLGGFIAHTFGYVGIFLPASILSLVAALDYR